MKASLLLLTILSLPLAAAEPAWLTSGMFHWPCSAPLIEPHPVGDDPDVALKDPSVVFHEGRWHLFGTHRRASGKVAMQYLSFTDWAEAERTERHPLKFMET
jgi:hypothetical protein